MRQTAMLWAAVFVAMGGPVGRAGAADVFVSPNGSPDGVGTRESPRDLASALEGRRGVRQGDTILLLGGTYRRRPQAEFSVRLVGEADHPIHVRPEPGARATIDGGLSIEEPSAHVWIQDLEVLVSENATLSREIAEPGSSPASYGRPWGGVHLRGGRDVKLIHLVIHDCAQGISAWSGAVDTEIYGCLIHDNGWKAPDRGHGHAIYTQNEKGTKVIRHCILSAKYEGSYTMHAYGSSRAYVDGYLIDGNIAYGLGPFLIGGGRPSRGIRVLGNALHGVDLRLGYDAPYNEDCVVRDNVIGGGSITISGFRSVVKERNLELGNGESFPGKLVAWRWFASRYRPDRAHLAVISETAREVETVPADPFLAAGDGYRLLDPKDFFGKPVAEGTCNDGSIPVPLKDGFAAFVVLRTPAVDGPTVERSEYRGWPSLKMSNGLVALHVVPELGGRVMQYRLGGKEFFWVNPALAGKPPPPGGLGPDGSWLNYGGDKLWPAPQGWDGDAEWPGPPDAVLDGSPYAVEAFPGDGSIRLESAPDRRSGIRFSRAIRLHPGSTRVTIDALMENIDTKPRRWGIWAHTQLDGARSDGPGHNALMKAWCPTNVGGQFERGYRVIFGLKDNPSFIPHPDRDLLEVRYLYEVGKVGVDSPDGWVATVDGASGAAFIQRFRFEAGKEYPDGSSVEFWHNGRGKIRAYGREIVQPDSPPANPYVFESEVLSPYAALGPREVFAWRYEWCATTVGGDHPVVAATDAGVTCEPLAAVRQDGKVHLRGRFGVFAPARLRALALDARRMELGPVDWSADVTPLAPVVVDVDASCPEAAQEIALVLDGGADRPSAQLARARIAPAAR